MASKKSCTTPLKTPKKTERIFFSPSGTCFCICCQKITPPKRRSCLLKDGNLSTAGQLVDSVIKIVEKTDFQIICEVCLKKFRNNEKKKIDLLTQVSTGRKESEIFLRWRFRRGWKQSTTDTASTASVLRPARRKKLFEENHVETHFPVHPLTDKCTDVRIL